TRIACSSTGDSGCSASAPLSASVFLSPAFLSPALSAGLSSALASASTTASGADAWAATGQASAAMNASPRKAAWARSGGALFVVVVLIGPVFALEGPVLLVVAHQPFQLQLREHLGRVAALAQVGDLDLQLLLLADDRVDMG